MTDLQRIRRETIRWQILLTLNHARPLGAMERVVLSVIQSEYPDATAQELRRELSYLSDRELVDLEIKPEGRWWCDLTRFGVDVVEYTVPVEPGIARPEKYYD